MPISLVADPPATCTQNVKSSLKLRDVTRPMSHNNQMDFASKNNYHLFCFFSVSVMWYHPHRPYKLLWNWWH